MIRGLGPPHLSCQEQAIFGACSYYPKLTCCIAMGLIQFQISFFPLRQPGLLLAGHEPNAHLQWRQAYLTTSLSCSLAVYSPPSGQSTMHTLLSGSVRPEHETAKPHPCLPGKQLLCGYRERGGALLPGPGRDAAHPLRLAACRDDVTRLPRSWRQLPARPRPWVRVIA